MYNSLRTMRYVAAGLISAFLFGAATPASKVLLYDIQPQTLAGLLYLGAALGVLPIIIKEGAFRRPRHDGRRTALLLSAAIVLGGIAGPILLLIALRYANAGYVSLWLNLELAATVILGHFLFREQLTFRGWIAACGTVAAAMLLVGGHGGVGIIPAILICLGCTCWGFDNHFTALIDGISPAQTTFWKGLVAGTVNLVIGTVIAGQVGATNKVLFALAVGALSYGISNTLYVTAAQGIGATRSQMIFSAAPFFGLLLSVTILGEVFTGSQFIAALIMGFSLVIVFSERHGHIHQHELMSHQHNHRHDELHHNHDHAGRDDSNDHLHQHEHQPVAHNHKHWPDLHHRHGHKDNNDR